MSQLQEGIYFGRGDSAPGFFALVLLNLRPGASRGTVMTTLRDLWTLYDRLKAGRVPDIHDQPDGTQAALVPGGQLKTLLGFGGPAFQLTAEGFGQPPNHQNYAFQQAVAGAPIASMSGKDSGIRFGSGQAELTDVSDAAFAVQFTALTPLAVERGVVETWKLLHDRGAAAPLEIGGVFTGAQRDDARSWIDFHDGLSNVNPTEREGVISIPGPGWTARGTYLAFARLTIDLEVWRSHDRKAQELMIGRNKVSGCAFSEYDAADRGIAVAGCPLVTPITDPRNRDLYWESPDPATTRGTQVRLTHIRRTNQHVTPSSAPQSFRIFRQGYPFLERSQASPFFRTGLNFVSFQNNPRRLLGILTTDSWLGGTNFGGGPALSGAGAPAGRLLTAYAAGIFFVPPRASSQEPFPGSAAFT